MKLYIVSLLILLFSFESYAQDSINNIKQSDLYGIWTFVEYNIGDQECKGVTLDPINQINFTKKGIYRIKQDSIILDGNYKLTNSKIKLFNTKKNDLEQSGTETLTIHSIEKQTLEFELPIECGIMYIKFKKQKK